MVVIVYSTQHCGGCSATKKHLDRRGIRFDEVPIDTSDDALMAAFDELGYTSAPVVCVATSDGEQSWNGYRPDRIDALRKWIVSHEDTPVG